MGLLLGLSVPAEARWPTRADEPLIVSPAGSNAEVAAACPDGSGGCYLAWSSYGAVWGWFVQHLNARGEELFAAGDLEIGTSLGIPEGIAPDGSGGAIVLTSHYLGSELGTILRASRLNATGEIEWTTTLAHLLAQSWSPFKLAVEQSGTEFTVAWFTWGTGPSVAWTQRFDNVGNVLWPATGVAAISAPYIQNLESITSDDLGGDWIAITDRDSSLSTLQYIHVQHVSVAGTARWPGPGVLVHSSGVYETHVGLAADGTGGVYLCWHSQVPTATWASIQHVREDGSLGFGIEGQQIPKPQTGFSGWPIIARAAESRAIVAWTCSPALGSSSTGIQEFDSAGTWKWPGPYVTASPAGRTQDPWGLFPNADGGFTLMAGTLGDGVMAAQRFSADGRRVWGDSAPIIMAVPADLDTYECHSIGQFVPNGDGGVTHLLSDKRGHADTMRIRAQHLDPYGRLGDTAPAILSLQDVPDDHGGFLQVHWRASSLQGDSAMSTSMYQVLRRQPGAHDPVDSVVGELTATSDTEYTAIAPTLGDSLSPTSSPTTLLIRALDATGRSWISLPDSARSVANLTSLDVGPRHDLLSLDPPEPSPASARARIRYSLPMPGLMSLALYDLAGRRIRTLIRRQQAAGRHAETIELVDASGERLSAGLYFMRLEVPGGGLRRNLVVIR
jgi:hypothetical protein